MRILFVGDLAPTGFGSVTLGLGRELLALGHDVRFISQNAWNSMPDGWEARTASSKSFAIMVNVLSRDAGAVPEDVIAGLVRGETDVTLEDEEPWGTWAAEAIILLGDYAATRALVALSPDTFAQTPTYHYCPIEGVDLPPAWADMWGFVHPVAMSKFGAAEIAKITGTEPPMIYHGVDVDRFRPVTPSDPLIIRTEREHRLTSKADCKQLWAHRFGGRVPQLWAGRTDRHMPRKDYNRLLRAMWPVLVRQPHVGLLIHTRPWDQGGSLTDTLSKMPGARNLMPIEEEHTGLGYAILDRDYPQILLTNTLPLDAEGLRSIYCALDLYVSPSSEGFGLTIAEAIACGTPALGLDFSSVPEVIGPAGRLAPVAGLVDNPYDHFWGVADVAEFGKMAEHLLTHQGKREELGRRGPRHIAEHFSWATAAREFSAIMGPVRLLA